MESDKYNTRQKKDSRRLRNTFQMPKNLKRQYREAMTGLCCALNEPRFTSVWAICIRPAVTCVIHLNSLRCHVITYIIRSETRVGGVIYDIMPVCHNHHTR